MYNLYTQTTLYYYLYMIINYLFSAYIICLCNILVCTYLTKLNIIKYIVVSNRALSFMFRIYLESTFGRVLFLLQRSLY